MDVKLLRIVSGEEIVAEVVSWENGLITLKNCLAVLPQGTTYGFMQWATVIDPDNPDVTLSMDHVIYVATAHPSVVAKYNEMYGSVIVPEEKKLIL
ncbi:hypothetical protein Syn7803C72_126 [Synechococcus phage ACG-2014d]|jgi:hypothetical protein|uniref:Uncharacterized protein n=1 Tax=Synechococcus phage ACG-2014d TaxID=1493509 RepID=A0A0E3FCJ9_9CAUD|nr:hypothetical protein AAJ59_gp126 [Synechococcus phage ACG-2014d]YP_010355296.1 hypothetical protein M1M12_gp127 [Synechococcus phage ACG-2014d]AIX14738.1 hypothetical protein Syn7803C45_127 [Synechococcus phage ACG-2014d]AIX14957.1 hypothetical protein Syn7803C46_126 [Synechococcus phage ACG-2014d]AIX15384.1 hypothetical protein Syn7803C48_126 [Synechococcus phage ACG-2014d]AIX15602.1 hypothetical protein Syn7803C49_126 [Synechococcus phage ACG-2014d]AIX16032.1 hypothetical protein Syn7803